MVFSYSKAVIWFEIDRIDKNNISHTLERFFSAKLCIQVENQFEINLFLKRFLSSWWSWCWCCCCFLLLHSQATTAKHWAMSMSMSMKWIFISSAFVQFFLSFPSLSIPIPMSLVSFSFCLISPIRLRHLHVSRGKKMCYIFPSRTNIIIEI